MVATRLSTNDHIIGCYEHHVFLISPEPGGKNKKKKKQHKTKYFELIVQPWKR